MFSINSLKRLEELKEDDYGYINEVNIIGCNVKIFPEIIFELFNLEILNIHSNNIEEIPDNFSNLPNLQELILDYNPIKILPKSLTNCKNFNSLSCLDTKIEKLGKWMEELTKLEYISLSNCNIKSINFDITKIHKVNITINSYSNINNLSEKCEYLQFNYLLEPVNNLPINLKKVKLFKPYEPINVKVPLNCKLFIVY